MSKSEHRIQAEILVAVTAEQNTMAWRNNVGTGWQGQRLSRAPGSMVKVERGMVILLDARPFTAGTLGSPDIIGVSDGRAIGLEVKAERGQLSESQINFRRKWMHCGGLYGVPRSVEEALRVLRGE